MSSIITTSIAAILTLFIFSFLYKDNPLYKFAEHLLVGISVGYIIGQIYRLGFISYVWNPIIHDHNYLYIIPTIIGLFYLGFVSTKTMWLIRIPIALGMGMGAGYGISYTFQTNIFIQLRETIMVFNHPGMGFWAIFANILLVIGVFTAIIYFFFSWKHEGAVGVLAKVGIYFLMIGFGASFGLTVMGRISLLIGRFLFLFKDWLHLISY
ncbi:hypothetical protein J7L48_06200 [bacterium]|nr:hypothetical protein [bacterium]